MPRYEIEMNGEKYEVEAPNDSSLSLVIQRLQGGAANTQATPSGRSGQDGSLMSVDNVVRGVARGALGVGSYLDEANAATNATLAPIVDPFLPDNFQKLPGETWQERYDQALAIQRGKDEAFDKQNSVASTALQVSGAIGSGVGLAKALPAAAGAIEGWATAPSSVAGQAARGFAVGGGAGLVEGAVSGFGRGEGSAEDRLGTAGSEAAMGGAGGAIVGAAMPVVAPLIKKSARAFLDDFINDAAAKRAGLNGPSARILNDALEADGAMGSGGFSRLAQSGDDAMLADAGSASQNVLDLAIQKGGAGANIAREAIEGRAGQAAATLNKALDDALGPVTNAAPVTPEARAAMGDLYNRAYAMPIDYSAPKAMEIERMVATRVPKSAIDAANDLMRVEGVASKQILADVADDGTVAFRRLPDVQQIDYITRGLREVADQADGQGKLGGTTARGRAYGNLAKEIRSRLRDLVPEWGEAVDKAGTEIGKVKARDFGYEMFSRGVPRSDVKDFAEGLGAAEKLELRAGLRAYIDDTMANVTRAVTDGNMDAREATKALKELSSRSAREKIAEIISPQDALKLSMQVDRAASALELRAGVATNSKTFARQNTQRIVDETNEPGAGAKLLTGKPVRSMQSAMELLMGQTPADRLAREREVFSDLAKALTGVRGDDAQKLLKTLQDIYAKNPENEALARLVARYGAIGIGIPAAEGTGEVIGPYIGAK